MVNTSLYEAAVLRSGKRKTFLAAKIGCTCQTLRRKAYNRSDFRVSEIEGLCKELGLSKSERGQIFFCPDVDKMGTKKGGSIEKSNHSLRGKETASNPAGGQKIDGTAKD